MESLGNVASHPHVHETLSRARDDSRGDQDFPRRVSAIVIGTGSRGNKLALFALDFPHRLEIVAFAEPQEQRRIKFQRRYKVKHENTFTDWKEVAKKERFADAVIIATLDHLHKEPAVTFAKMGYHILLEKPMAQTQADCQEIVDVCKANGTILVVGHVLRYHPQYLKVNQLIKDGVIGTIVHVQHMEPVGWNHFAHSYVRGNWRKKEESGFSLLTKSCHDIDLVYSFMQGAKCLKISSFGSLSHFKRQNKPKEAANRCLDCQIENSCPYSAVQMYLDPVRRGHPHEFCRIVCDTDEVAEMENILRTGPYGRCVFECDNDVMSNQVVNMEYEGGKTASFSMVAFTEKLCIRKTTIYGTNGEMECNEDAEISVFDFKTGKRTVYPVQSIPSELTHQTDHQYGDYYLTYSFVKAVSNGSQKLSLSGPDDTMESHRLVFMAEKSRLEGRVINLI